MAVSPAFSPVKTFRPMGCQPGGRPSWETMAERWGVSPDLWELAALFHPADLSLTSDESQPSVCRKSAAKLETPRERIDVSDLQEAELRATEALKKRLETQVAILNDDISRLKESLQKKHS